MFKPWASIRSFMFRVPHHRNLQIDPWSNLHWLAWTLGSKYWNGPADRPMQRGQRVKIGYQVRLYSYVQSACGAGGSHRYYAATHQCESSTQAIRTQKFGPNAECNTKMTSNDGDSKPIARCASFGDKPSKTRRHSRKGLAGSSDRVSARNIVETRSALERKQKQSSGNRSGHEFHPDGYRFLCS